jgi:hypothetical protein
MSQAIEIFVAVTALIIGLSHLLRPQDWSDTILALHRTGRPGAFANGAIHMFPGVVIVAGHWVWSWPEAVLTFLGCVLVVKGAIGFLLPDVALRSMSLARVASRFRGAGIFGLAIAGWAIYCLWHRAANL